MEEKKKEKTTDKILSYMQENNGAFPAKKEHKALRITSLVLLGPAGLIGEAFFGLGCYDTRWNMALEAYKQLDEKEIKEILDVDEEEEETK